MKLPLAFAYFILGASSTAGASLTSIRNYGSDNQGQDLVTSAKKKPLAGAASVTRHLQMGKSTKSRKAGKAKADKSQGTTTTTSTSTAGTSTTTTSTSTSTTTSTTTTSCLPPVTADDPDDGFPPPLCMDVGRSCTSGDLLAGVGNAELAPQFNTFDCPTIETGTPNNVSIESITVSDEGNCRLGPGRMARVQVEVRTLGTARVDNIFIYATTIASTSAPGLDAPLWTLIGQGSTRNNARVTFRAEYKLPENPPTGSIQVVRAVFGLDPPALVCPTTSRDDVDLDDLAFPIVSSMTAPIMSGIQQMGSSDSD